MGGDKACAGIAVPGPAGAPGLKYGNSPHVSRIAPRAAFLFANSSAVTPVLRHIESRCSAMLEFRAYVHHYEKYGTTAADLEAALASLRAQIADYDGLAPSVASVSASTGTFRAPREPSSTVMVGLAGANVILDKSSRPVASFKARASWCDSGHARMFVSVSALPWNTTTPSCVTINTPYSTPFATPVEPDAMPWWTLSGTFNWLY